MSRSRRAIVLLAGAVACGDGAAPEPVVRPGPPGAPQPYPPPDRVDRVVRPTAVAPLSLDVTTHAVPGALAGDGELHFAVQDDGRVLMGGAAGLYADTATVSGLSVLGLIESDAVGFLVATTEGVYVYDGALIPSRLDDALDGDRVRAFAPRGNELWFASDRALYQLVESELFAFDTMRGVASIATFAGDRVGVETASASYAMLVQVGADWTRQDLGGELTLSAIAPAAGGRTFGVSGGRLVERIARSTDGAFVWRRVALTTDPSDPGAEDVARLVVDPTSGSLWIVQPDRLSRIDGTRVGTADVPAGMGVVVAARVTGDGALWISDGATLARIGSSEPPLSFEAHVRPFSDRNCARCHAPMLGISTLVLESLEDWRSNIDEIIEQVEAGRMPLDGMPLASGGSDLPARWLEGGMRP